MTDAHICGVCFRVCAAHPPACNLGCRHFPPLCCPGCQCRSYEDAPHDFRNAVFRALDQAVENNHDMAALSDLAIAFDLLDHAQEFQTWKPETLTPHIAAWKEVKAAESRIEQRAAERKRPVFWRKGNGPD